MLETRIIVIILLALELIIVITNWLRYQSFRKLEHLITEHEKHILTGQIIIWFILFTFIPIWLASILIFGYNSSFSIFGINIIPSLLGWIIILSFVVYISASAIKNQLFLHLGNGIKANVIRGTGAIIWGVLLMGVAILPLFAMIQNWL